jgi:hypothetical protein
MGLQRLGDSQKATDDQPPLLLSPPSRVNPQYADAENDSPDIPVKAAESSIATVNQRETIDMMRSFEYVIDPT